MMAVCASLSSLAMNSNTNGTRSAALDYLSVDFTTDGAGTLEVAFAGVSNHTYVMETSETLSSSNTWSYRDSIGPLLGNGPQTLTATVPGDPGTLFGRVKGSLESLGSPTAIYVPEGYSFVWGDHFSATTIDTSKWVVASLRDPVSGDLVPGAQGDHLLNDKYEGYVTEEDSYAEEGSLILLNQKRPYTGTSPAGNYNYTSGWIMSMHRGYFNKCYIEVRAKFPSGDKVWPAIWLIAEDLTWGPEWDLWEYFGYRNNIGYDNMGTHLMTGPWNNVKWDSSWIQPFDDLYDCETWHVYGWEWTDTQAVWTIDDVVVHTLQKSATKDPAAWPDEEMYIVLNNGTKTASPDSNTTWPNQLEIDYIEVYQ